MRSRFKEYLINLIVPSLVLGGTTGILTAILVLLYKLCAGHVIQASEQCYAFLRANPLWILPVVACLLGISFLLAALYRRQPSLKGGGIPMSVGLLRGLLTFAWWRNLVGVFFLSLGTFFLGVPLGNEGPSVQMGTAIGHGAVAGFAGKRRAWDRYAMTGGACAGFSVATGAPISGILFAIEEAHQRISPMIIAVSATAVLFASGVVELVAPRLGLSATLLPHLSLPRLRLADAWIPLVVGLLVGLFAVLILWYYRRIRQLLDHMLAKVPYAIRLFFVLLLTLGLGLCSFCFISTGHELLLHLLEGQVGIVMLLLLLLVRPTLTLLANANGITGGMFLPLLCLGGVLSATVAEICERFFGLSEDYGRVLLILGIVACIASLMKMPITAIVFAVEALGCYENILAVIFAAVLSYTITEVFEAKSINDTVLEQQVRETARKHERKVIDAHLMIGEGSFAVGRQIRDILWPSNLFVLSVTRSRSEGAVVDGHGGRELAVGDWLHVRYSTRDEARTRADLLAIVGEQDFKEKEIRRNV